MEETEQLEMNKKYFSYFIREEIVTHRIYVNESL